MTAQALLSEASIVVAPGLEHTVGLTVRNLGNQVETFAVTPTGFCAGWVTVSPASVTLNPDEQQSVAITVRPPRAPTITSGDSVLALRIVPHGRPADVAVAEATITVLGFTARRLLIGQPVQLASRSATYDVVVENLGNQYATCRLAMTDASGRLIGRFDPPSVGVDPGQSANSRLRVRSKGMRWLGEPLATGFVLEAEENGRPIATSHGTFVQTPLVRSGLIGALVGLIALGGVLFGAWRAVVHPAIDDAAEDAVAAVVDADGITPSASVTTPSGPAPSDSGAPSASLPVDSGEVLNLRVAPTADPGATKEEVVETATTSIEISDIVVQNPNEDTGTLTIGIGDEVLFTFNLAAVYGYEQVELRTPVVVPSGEALVVRLECSAPGSSQRCAPAVFLSGHSR